jgi:hypothetical protein
VITLAACAVGFAGCGGGDSRTAAEQQLIAKADAICATAWQAMKQVSGEFPPDRPLDIRSRIELGQALADVSTPMNEGLGALRPPAGMRDAYNRFLESERQVHYDDLTAVGASHAAHVGVFESARERREKDLERSYEHAAEAGLDTCASSD